eukprot:TRINITY_DN225_c0_g2_i1.p1 TRINITY_DN225_c0_g2~~TRINITY_DN225_c0_g2_i1.p1  ORF type:complete len:263 (-),score=16.16 TRINITY_DN225_c0_g2_i1:833-1621(-)
MVTTRGALRRQKSPHPDPTVLNVPPATPPIAAAPAIAADPPIEDVCADEFNMLSISDSYGDSSDGSSISLHEEFHDQKGEGAWGASRQSILGSSSAVNFKAHTLPRLESLVVVDEGNLRLARNDELFRSDDHKLVKVQFLERNAAIVCPCGECHAFIKLGVHGAYALNASSTCVHCGQGPFACEATLRNHTATKKCRKARQKSLRNRSVSMSFDHLQSSSINESCTSRYQLMNESRSRPRTSLSPFSLPALGQLVYTSRSQS